MGVRSSPVRIIPSIASADPLNLQGELDRLAGISNIHLDIEDGNFLPNITFGMKTVRRVSEYLDGSRELDAHLFVTQPARWIDELAACRIKRVSFQMEAVAYPLEVLSRIHHHKMKVGVGLNFATPAEAVLPFLPHLDYVVVMTAEPDGRGMNFYPPMLDKIQKLSQYLRDDQEIWADGGIDRTTIRAVASAGASVMILGRALFSATDPLGMAKELQTLCH